MKKIIGYLFLDDEDAYLRGYRKAQKMKELKQLFRQMNVERSIFYVDETPAGTNLRQRRTELLDDLEDVSIFAAVSLFELGDNFYEILNVLKKLDEHHVRVILVTNHIDTMSLRHAQ